MSNDQKETGVSAARSESFFDLINAMAASMKNFLRNLVTCSTLCTFLLLGFVPIFGLTLMGGYPVASNEAETSKNQGNAGNADKAGTSNQSSPENTNRQKSANQGMQGCAGEKETACPSH
jgi:hypothetical protein